MNRSLEEKLSRVEPHLVGLWRFRVAGQKPKWCCTYTWRGKYYDTYGQSTPEAALDKVHQSILRLKSRSLKSRQRK